VCQSAELADGKNGSHWNQKYIKYNVIIMNIEQNNNQFNENHHDAQESGFGRHTPDDNGCGPRDHHGRGRRRLKKSFTIEEAWEIGCALSKALIRDCKEGNPEPRLEPQEIECLVEMMTCPEDECSPG
jgi:hypothetical protein